MIRFGKKENIEIKITGMFECKVCGTEFKLDKDNKYVVQENKGINAIASGTKKFECFDCPQCGCQNIVNIREG